MGSPPLSRSEEAALRAERAMGAGLQGEPDQPFLSGDDSGNPFPGPCVHLYHLRLAVFNEYSEAVKKREKMRKGMWPSLVNGTAAIRASLTSVCAMSSV